MCVFERAWWAQPKDRARRDRRMRKGGARGVCEIRLQQRDVMEEEATWATWLRGLPAGLDPWHALSLAGPSRAAPAATQRKGWSPQVAQPRPGACGLASPRHEAENTG